MTSRRLATVGHDRLQRALSLRKALDDGVRPGVLIRNPATAARPPRRTKPEMETWTAAQLGEFLAGVEDDPLLGVDRRS